MRLAWLEAAPHLPGPTLKNDAMPPDRPAGVLPPPSPPLLGPPLEGPPLPLPLLALL